MDKGKVAFILPHDDFDDHQYSKIRSFLEEKGYRAEVGSTHLSEAQGRFKNLVNIDFLVRDLAFDDYDAFIFIGGDGAREYYHDTDLHQLVRRMVSERKVIALIGQAVPILYYTGVTNGKKVTAPTNLKNELEAGGAYYTGKNIEQDGELITGFDERSAEDVARAIDKSVSWQKKDQG